MRVTFNAFPDTLLGRLQSLGSEQNKALTQLSTGQRIAAPSDDAPAMQRVLNLRTEKKQNQQFHRNATDGLERSKVTFSTMEQLKDLLVRSSELAANLSGASSDQEYKAKAAEIDQLIQQGVNLGNTKLRGSYLFSGESTEKIPFVSELQNGKITSVGYQGSDNEALMHIGEGESMTVAVSATAEENGDISGILNEMIRLRDAMLSFDFEEVSAIRGGEKLDGKFATTLADPLDPQSKMSLPLNHGLKSGDKISINLGKKEVGGPTEGEGLESGIYFVKESTANTVTLSKTPGGPPVGITSNITPLSTFQRVGGLQHMEDAILSALSRQGTIQYRLETAMKDLETRYEATEQLISKDADIDFAEATVRLNRAQMAYQAAIQSGAMIQRNSLLDYVR
jgi:flagellar hook-associated protein 3 FlgL